MMSGKISSMGQIGLLNHIKNMNNQKLGKVIVKYAEPIDLR